MKKLEAGVFRVADGEVLTLEATDVGPQTNFGVTFGIFGTTGVMKKGQPVQIEMDKSRAKKNSQVIQGAKVAELDVTGHFDSSAGGKYQVELTGAPSGDEPDIRFLKQRSQNQPDNIFYVFHIV